MGEAQARGAERAIDRDRWGRGEPGDTKKDCPAGCRKMYRIHPAIGVARVGNSPDQYFIGAETESFQNPSSFFRLNQADPTKMPEEIKIATTGDKTIYKDKKYTSSTKGQIRRQAARFRIFEYRSLDDGKTWLWTREITSADAQIKWTVKLANKKGSFNNFHGPDMAFEYPPGSGQKIRKAPTIEPPEASITIKNGFDPRSAPMSTATLRKPSGKYDEGGEEIAYLGEILHDEKGRLVVLGGRGKAGAKTSPTDSSPPKIETYANNPGWVDDVSDGWIAAEIKFPKEATPIKTADGNGDAWVLVTPPDFGPELTNVTSLYDTMIDVFVRTQRAPKGPADKVIYVMHGIEDRVKGNYLPYFDYDLRRLFEATVQTATVFKPANPQMKHPAVQKLAEDTHRDDFNEKPADVRAGLAPRAHLRYKIFNTLRPPWLERKRDPEEATYRDASEQQFHDVPSTVDHNFPVVPPPDKPAKAVPAENEKELKRYQQYRWTMPLAWGDSSSSYKSTRCSVTETQYKLVRAWWKGHFVETPSDDFDHIPRSEAITPGGLDRAALERCCGAPFWPGIEASWLTRCPDIYVEPLRVKRGLKANDFKVEVDQPGGGKFKAFQPHAFPTNGLPVDAGFFSQQMAQPWHADFLSCLRRQRDPSAPPDPANPMPPQAYKIGWWPAQRPDDVIRGGVADADPTALEGPTKVSATARTVTSFGAAGVAELSRHPRNITFTTGGRVPECAPLKVTVKGKDEKGKTTDETGDPYGETIDLPRVAKTVRGDKLYSVVTEVAYGPANKPVNTNATVSIGYDAAGNAPADDSGLESSTTVTTSPRTVTTFKPSGLTALAAQPRHVTFHVGGSQADEAPMTATVTGTDAGGNTQTETISLDFIALTPTPTNKLYASVTSVTYSAGRPKLDATVSIGIGTFMGGMERWDAGIHNWQEMSVNWWRLGFVVKGSEIERDPTLPSAPSIP
jgi:hypothetical protein